MAVRANRGHGAMCPVAGSGSQGAANAHHPAAQPVLLGAAFIAAGAHELPFAVIGVLPQGGAGDMLWFARERSYDQVFKALVIGMMQRWLNSFFEHPAPYLKNAVRCSLML